jgi:hypothetical protein
MTLGEMQGGVREVSVAKGCLRLSGELIRPSQVMPGVKRFGV